MFTTIKHKTFTDRPYNEDCYGISDHFVFVIDGATGLGDNDYMGCGDDAAWFVTQVKEYLMKHLHEDKPISTILKEITSRLLIDYKNKADHLDLTSMPSACISLFRIQNNTLEFYGLGDCVGLVEFKNGDVDFSIDHNLERLDGLAIRKMVEISKEQQISPIKARPQIHELLCYHRTLRNTPEGYYSLDLSGIGLDHAIYKTWNLNEVKRVASFSDGFYEVMAFHLYSDYHTLLEDMKKDLDYIYHQLFEAQDNDFEAYQVPRFKKRDDTTAVYAEIIS